MDGVFGRCNGLGLSELHQPQRFWQNDQDGSFYWRRNCYLMGVQLFGRQVKRIINVSTLVILCNLKVAALTKETQREFEWFDSLGFSAKQTFTNYSTIFLWKNLNAYPLSDAFLSAWKRWKDGSEQEAEALFLQSRASRELGSKRLAKKSYHELLEQELAERFMWQGYLKIGSAWVSRSTLKEEFRLVAKKFPHSDCASEALENFKILDLMAKEDSKRSVLPFEEIENLPLERKIEELIYALRDQNAVQGRQPGRCDIFWSRSGVTNTAAHYLAAIGHPAVPKLIGALEDRRLTRSIEFHRRFYYSHIAITVGECARQILERISGEKFLETGPQTYMMSKEEIRETQRAVKKWWRRELRKNGNSGERRD